jgi:hypothetical protein
MCRPPSRVAYGRNYYRVESKVVVQAGGSWDWLKKKDHLMKVNIVLKRFFFRLSMQMTPRAHVSSQVLGDDMAQYIPVKNCTAIILVGTA